MTICYCLTLTRPIWDLNLSQLGPQCGNKYQRNVRISAPDLYGSLNTILFAHNYIQKENWEYLSVCFQQFLPFSVSLCTLFLIVTNPNFQQYFHPHSCLLAYLRAFFETTFL